MKSTDNPFPAQAVAVYGPEIASTATFSYMDRVRKALQTYVTDYPDASIALALSGGHGSGKTHLLMWLSREIGAIKQGGTQIIYIKTDGTDPVELYRQVMRALTRETLLGLQREALVTLGASRAGAVQATQADARNIRDFESLGSAVADKIVDLNALHIQLRNALIEAMSESAADVVRRAAAAIGLLDDPEYGEGAFGWLCGDAVAGLPNTSLATGLFESNAGADDVAIFALETVAALFRLAGRPLVILIDQIENLLTFDETSKKSSILKKIVEQLRHQRAALVMAGTPAGWERMPRDVGPRLLDRGPWLIAALTRDEAAELLRTRLDVAQEGDASITPQAVVTIHELSGGNAREILRIAYHAFAMANGDLGAFDRALLTKAAISSGTLADRRAFAAQMIEEVALAERLDVLPGEAPVDCEIRTREGAALRIVIAVAADATQEAGFAREVARAFQQRGDGTQSEILVISVGYSSRRVEKLLKGVSEVLVFDETSLKAQLRERLRTLKAATPVTVDSGSQTQFEERLAQLDGQLQQLHDARAESERRIAELLAERTDAAAEPAREAAEVRTRYELRDGLDRLSDALAAPTAEDERKAIRRLLIANEINVHDPAFDFLGSLYLDALDLERGESAASRGNPTDWREGPIRELRHVRADIVSAMRKLLTEQTPLAASRSTRATFAGIMGLAIAVFAFISIAFLRYTSATNDYRYDPLQVVGSQPRFEDYMINVNVNAVLFPLIIGLLFGAMFYLSLEIRMRPNVRYRGMARALHRVRRELRSHKDA